jgi:4-amino-4-deoxy-L-arabinose transferase-like glycosyltransferase
VALAVFWRIDRGSGRRRDLALLHGAIGLGVLTKGPVALLVPLLAMAAYLGWERRLTDLRRVLPPWALLLSLGPGIAWLAAAGWLAPAGFLDGAVVDNLLGRFFSGSSHARPFYYYLYQFPVNFLPWTLLWPVVAWFAATRVFRDGADPERARAWRFLLAWVGAALVFFSLSTGKRGLYLLPVFPAVALLCADALHGLRELRSPETQRRFSARFGAIVALVFAVELGAFTLFFPALDPEKSPRPVATAAAALTTPDEPVGLTRRSLVGGIAYYGRRRTRVLETSADVERFFADGGRVIVVPMSQLQRVTRLTAVVVEARIRSGARALLVVTPAGAQAPDASAIER